MIYYKLFFGEYNVDGEKLRYFLKNQNYYGKAIVRFEEINGDFGGDVEIDIKKWEVEIGKNFIIWHGNASPRNIDYLVAVSKSFQKESPTEKLIKKIMKKHSWCQNEKLCR